MLTSSYKRVSSQQLSQRSPKRSRPSQPISMDAPFCSSGCASPVTWTALPGRLNGNRPFEDFKDCDDLVGPFLEAIIQAEYNWIPWEAVRSISMEPPKHVRDLIWIPARIELCRGVVGEAFLPVLYANSY